jgi:riboflavin kinase/FMN adenylyltransferase
MRVFYDIDEIKKDLNTYLTLGTFDGLHLGHQQILKEVVDRSKKNSGRSFLVTFNPHPRLVLNSNVNKIKLLTTTEEKLKLIEELGIENVLVINFTKEFSQISSYSFIKDFLYEKIGLKEIIIGHDHQFGKGREGNREQLENTAASLNFSVDVIGPVTVNDTIISSTKIRHAITEGDIDKAAAFLGRFYSFEGRVIEGDKRGRTLGFPTVNIAVEESKQLPKIGIYAGRIYVDGKKYNGVMSLGVRPTFYNSTSVLPEFFIFDFNEDIYGKNVKVEVIKYLREEKKYNIVDDLVSQMRKDVLLSKEILLQNN